MKNGCTCAGNGEKKELETPVDDRFKKYKKYQQFVDDPDVLQYLKNNYAKKKTES